MGIRESNTQSRIGCFALKNHIMVTLQKYLGFRDKSSFFRGVIERDMLYIRKEGTC